MRDRPPQTAEQGAGGQRWEQTGSSSCLLPVPLTPSLPPLGPAQPRPPRPSPPRPTLSSPPSGSRSPSGRLAPRVPPTPASANPARGPAPPRTAFAARPAPFPGPGRGRGWCSAAGSWVPGLLGGAAAGARLAGAMDSRALKVSRFGGRRGPWGVGRGGSAGRPVPSLRRGPVAAAPGRLRAAARNLEARGRLRRALLPQLPLACLSRPTCGAVCSLAGFRLLGKLAPYMTPTAPPGEIFKDLTAN